MQREALRKNNQITVTIDKKDIQTHRGKTILEVCREHGIHIPTLCYHPRLRILGACRVCVVEVEGVRTLMTACTTPVDRSGMVVNTKSERVLEARRVIVELLLASGDHNCLYCEANGKCELQDLVYELKIEQPRFPVDPPKWEVDNSNPMIFRDLNKCILCGRCVWGCNEVQVNNVIDFGYRGSRAKIVTAHDKGYGASICVFCGECVQLCPTGALVDKKAMFGGRPWDATLVPTTCPYCGTGCTIDLHVVDGKVVKITGTEEGVVNRGSLCVKGRYGYDFIHHADRLTTPLIKENGAFREASWDEALDVVARRLTAIKNEYGPNSIGGLSSARCTNEENYLMQKFIRAVIGTNNIDHCARLCHSSTVAGLAAAFGGGAMTNSIDEIYKSDVLFLTGTNTTENHPVIAIKMKQAIVKGNATLIVADPRKIDMVRFAHLWLRHKPGTDVALFNGLMNAIIEEGLYAKGYVKQRTDGFEDLRNAVKGYPPDYVEKITGVPAEDIRQAARIYAQAKRAAIYYAMGITQHVTGTDNVKSLANLAMLCGHVGIEGGGVNPLRGQHNVQGSCDMGALPNVFTGYQPVIDEEARKKFEEAWVLVGLPVQPGLTVTEMIPAAAQGKIKALYMMGENSMLSEPDLKHAEEGLKNLDFLVVQDIFMTETARLADVILPAASFAEKDGTFTNTERRVQRVRKAVDAPGQARADWRIIADLAIRMGYTMPYRAAEDIFKEMATVTPSYAGITYKRIDKEGGLQWPCPTPRHPGTPYLHKDRFTRGKGLFHAVQFILPAELPDQEYPLLLSTGRVLYHYHTGTMTRRSEGLNFRYPEARVEVNPVDAEELGIEDGEMVRVASRRGAIEITATVTPRSPQGTVFIPFHFFEAAANRLTNSALDPIAKIPEYKVCAVKVARVT